MGFWGLGLKAPRVLGFLGEGFGFGGEGLASDSKGPRRVGGFRIWGLGDRLNGFLGLGFRKQVLGSNVLGFRVSSLGI